MHASEALPERPAKCVTPNAPSRSASGALSLRGSTPTCGVYKNFSFDLRRCEPRRCGCARGYSKDFYAVMQQSFYAVCFARCDGVCYKSRLPHESRSVRREELMEKREVSWHRWDEMPKEAVTESLDRRLITGERMMLAHVYLRKGAVVPRHSHDNEQITYILEGALRFWIGDD